MIHEFINTPDCPCLFEIKISGDAIKAPRFSHILSVGEIVIRSEIFPNYALCVETAVNILNALACELSILMRTSYLVVSKESDNTDNLVLLYLAELKDLTEKKIIQHTASATIIASASSATLSLVPQ